MKSKSTRIFFSVILGIFAMTSIYPLVWLIKNSLKTTPDILMENSFLLPRTLMLENYYDAIMVRRIYIYFLNSTINTALTIVVVVLLSSMLAYATSRMLWKGRHAVTSVVTLGILFPSQLAVVPIFILIRTLGLLDTRWSLILTVSSFSLAFSFLIAHSFLKTIPYEMEEAAAMDGAGVFKIFFFIILPIIKPVIASMSIFVFLSSWNEFVYALILIRSASLRTLPISLTLFDSVHFGKDYGPMFAAMVFASILPIAMYIFFSSKVENALTAGSILK